MDDEESRIRFFVNGSEVIEDNPDPEMTLLYYIRNKLHLTGSKLGCGEGGCGACTVMVSYYDKRKSVIRHKSVNACLAPLCSMDGMAVTTVEGIGSARDRLHPCQERIAKAHGSQCGFCTPGFVMSMYTLLRNNSQPTETEIEHAFEGNLCRCTGYRPILEGYKTFCCGGSRNGAECGGGCCNLGNKDYKSIEGSGVLFDASKFIPLDRSQEPIFPPKLKLNYSSKPLAIKGPRVQWYRPITLSQLLELRNRFPHHHDRSKPQYRLVAGNTELGVEVALKGCHYPVLIAPSLVPELCVFEVTDDGLLVGAAVTLSDLKVKLIELKSSLPEYKTRVFSALLEILRWFAGPQIRNVSSIAGQIVTGSPIADLNPVLICCQATIRLASIEEQRCVVMDADFYTGYRQTCLKPNEVLVSVLIPFTKQHQYVAAYKQSRRREDDIAIVNSCFSVTLDDSGVVKHSRLVYGGMEKTTIVAKKTQQTLIGKVWGEEMLTAACNSLAEELAIPYDAPGGMPVYRLSLTLSFFYKFYLLVSSQLDSCQLPDSCRTAIEDFHRMPSRSTQGFQRVSKDQPQTDKIGRPMMHLSAIQQATGEAAYIDDLPTLEGELYAGLVISERAHATFTLDCTALESMKGVRCVVTVEDVPGSNIAGLADDELVFAVDKVTAIGQLIAIVVADNKLLAKQAVKLVKVTYKDLPAILTIEDAIAAGEFFSPVFKLQRGDVQADLTAAHTVVEGTTRSGGQEHFYLETNATIAIPKTENGEMELITSSQSICQSQTFAAKALGVPANRIVARVKRIGGAFGGKESRNFFLSSALAVAANKVRAPVRIMLDRNEDMLTTGHRHPFMAKYKVGFTEKGKITSLYIQLYSNAGYSLDMSAGVTARAVIHATNCYDIPNVRIEGRICRTNLPSNTAFRGFGGPQGMFIMEQIIDHVAHKLSMEPSKVREVNLCPLECDLVYSLRLTDCHIMRCWQTLMSRSKYSQRNQEVEQYNKNSKWKKRGLAIVPTMYGVGFSQAFLDQGSALVHVYTDGSVLLSHGGMEMGQGLHTKMIQVCARCLSIPVEKIFLCDTASDKIANASGTGASVSSDLYGGAVQDACNQLMTRLEPYLKTGLPWDQCVKNAYMDRVNLSAHGFYAIPDVSMDWNSGRGRPYSYYTYGAGCSEVEVDCLTGNFQILRSDLLMDVGDSLNPAIDIGQVEGAFTQGLGMFTMEECVFLKNGRLFTTGPGAYKIPAVSDIPIELNVTLLDHTPNPRAIFSSKAVGEPPLFLASSVFFAIKDAIRIFRKENGSAEPFQLLAPATAEKIRMACQDEFTITADIKQREKYGDPAPPWNIVP